MGLLERIAENKADAAATRRRIVDRSEPVPNDRPRQAKRRHKKKKKPKTYQSRLKESARQWRRAMLRAWEQIPNRHPDTVWEFRGRIMQGPDSQHRVIYRKAHGKIRKHHDIHHIDANPANNHIDNLISLHRDVHKALHRDLYKKGKKPPTREDIVRYANLYEKGVDPVALQPKTNPHEFREAVRELPTKELHKLLAFVERLIVQRIGDASDSTKVRLRREEEELRRTTRVDIDGSRIIVEPSENS